MKKIWLAVAVLAIAAGIYYLVNNDSAPKPVPPPGIMVSENRAGAPAPADKSGNGSNAASPPPAAVAATTELASRAASPNENPAAVANGIPVLPPATVLDNARVAIHNYNAAFGENPIGNNAEITAALMGNNPKQIHFITAEAGLRVNADAEVVDGYGTPFFFHQLSGHEMEIRSAGEDRRLWTFDDLVTR